MLQKVNPMKDLAERIKQGVEVIPTGFHTLDMMCGGGIEKGGIMTIPAIPGTGKTALATTITKNALEQGLKVCFLTLEMSEERVAERVLQAFWKESASKVREHIDDMTDLPGELFVVAPGNSIDKVETALTSCLEADLMIIDYFQLISNKETNNHFSNLELISNRLKAFAFEHKKPLIILSQLNRDIMKDRRNREPILSDIRGTGALEQDASIVAFLWDKNIKVDESDVQNASEDKSVQEKKEKLGMKSKKIQPQSKRDKDLRLIVRKNRNGSLGTIYMEFDPITMRFWEDEDTTFRL
jgi:replicative DNA helicase